MAYKIEYESKKVWRKISKNIRLYHTGLYRVRRGRHLSKHGNWCLGWNLEVLYNGKWTPCDSRGRHRTLYLMDEAIKMIKEYKYD